MSIVTAYNEKILEEVLREFLQDGEIPTADMLIEAYEERTASHPDMSKPFILDSDYSVEEYADSSASAYNAFFERAKWDLEAVYKEIWDRMGDGMESFDRWRIGLDKLKKKLLDLETRIDALLLLRGDTAGYFAFVEDNFVDFSKINQEQTTAKVDVTHHAVTLNYNLEDTTNLNLNEIDTQNATFTILTREHILSSSAAPGTSVSSAIEDVARSWQHRVRTVKPVRSITGELKVKLSNEPVDITKIKMQLHSSNTNGAVIITAMYSLDNYNWYNLPTDSYTQSADEQAMWVFPATQMQWVKFIMTKTGADDVDNGQYVYEFGALWIKFSSTATYDTTTGNLLVSKELSAYDDDGNRVPFNKLSLQTCQETPDETDILYSVIAKSDTEETEELRIDPYTIEDPKQPTVLELGRMVEQEETDLQPVSKTQQESIDFFSTYYDSDQRDMLQSDNLVLVGTDNTTILYISADEASRMLEDQIVFYRNIGDAGGTPTLSERSVREAPRGWSYDETETYLTTRIVIKNQDGLRIDLGNEEAWLDGATVKNIITIPQGKHWVKIHTKNVAELPDGYDDYTDEADIAGDDPLYPFNHKLLIEGVPYASDFSEEKRYLGADIYCQYIGQRVSIFDLLHNTEDDDYSRYAVDTTANGRRVFVVKFDPADTDLSNERFALTYATDNNMFDRIVLKAELSSTASSGDKTPILTAYRIKLGA